MSERKDLKDPMLTGPEEESQRDIASDNDKEEELRIGLWGTVGSGKTTYLAMLYQAVLERDGVRIEECDKKSEDFISDVYDEITWEGQFPPPTSPVPTEMNTYSFRIYRDAETTERRGFLGAGRSTPSKSAVLTVMDAGGEWYRDPRAMLEQWADQFEDELNPIASLAHSDGIICLLDMKAASQHGPEIEGDETSNPTGREFFRDLRSLFIQMKRYSETKRGYLNPYVAFCLSKIDFSLAWPYRDQPEELIHQFFENRVQKIIDNYCHPDKVKWFGVSAVGTVENEKGEEVSAVTKDGRIRNPGDLSPYNLLEPICWLLYRASEDEDWLVK